MTQGPESGRLFAGIPHFSGGPGDDDGLEIGGIHGRGHEGRPVIPYEGDTHLGRAAQQIHLPALPGTVEKEIRTKDRGRQ